MFFIVDMHAHTTASTDAYSTLMDYVSFAKEHSITGFGISDYGPGNASGPEESYFNNLDEIPRYIDDVLILKGVESNIISHDGTLDIKSEQMKHLDYAIVSFNNNTLKARSKSENTDTLIRAIKQNKVKIISDLAIEKHPIHIEKIVEVCKSADIAIEISNKRLSRLTCNLEYTNFGRLIQYAYKKGTKIILNSDAHYHSSLGEFDECFQFIDDLGIPRDYALNYHQERFFNWLAVDNLS